MKWQIGDRVAWNIDLGTRRGIDRIGIIYARVVAVSARRVKIRTDIDGDEHWVRPTSLGVAFGPGPDDERQQGNPYMPAEWR